VHTKNTKQAQNNGEFLSQLAQFSTREGIAKDQNSIQELVSSLQSNQALQASALIGRKVLITSSSLILPPIGETKIAVELPEGLDYLNTLIYTPFKTLVKTLHQHPSSPGLFQYSWDGSDENNQRVAPGLYHIEACGNLCGKPVYLKTMIFGNVDSVHLGPKGEGLTLNVSGLGSVSLDEVKQISLS
jgi:flagellar basal-body rod modification protein FlgD